MNIAEYIIDRISTYGVRHIFMITGGQAMFLNDAVYRSKKIKPVFHHHEQAAGMAAEAYGRITGNIGVAMVTAGPAGVNVLNGVVGAYVDSAPMLVISGQSSSANVRYMQKTGIRQYGLQGIFMKPLATPVTKYYVSVDDPLQIRYIVDKALYLATHGRPGPVWIDVPLDMQRMAVPDMYLKEYDPLEDAQDPSHLSKESLQKIVHELSLAKRPILVVGQGVRIAGAQNAFEEFLRVCAIPVVTTRLGIDLIRSNHPLFIGRAGLYGDRAANAAVQSADVILSIGARLDQGFVGHDIADWGRKALKIIVDIDEKELAKPGLEPSVRIRADARDTLENLTAAFSRKRITEVSRWTAHWKSVMKEFPTVLKEYAQETPVNSYYLSDRLSAVSSGNDTIVVDTSSPFHVVCQAWSVKSGQRFLTTGGISTMGYWPAAIGAAYARPKGNTIVITGDGCLQMNLQELATVKANKLNLKLFVIDNGGYLLIRHTQKTHMEGRLLGESKKTGLFIPDSVKIAQAYGIKAYRIDTPVHLDRKLKTILKHAGPAVISVTSPVWQLIAPRVASEKTAEGKLIAKPYEDLYPYVSRTDLDRIMKPPTS